MSSASLKMSADAASAAPTDRKVIDDAVAAVKSKAREFARLPPAKKAALVRECIPRLLAEAPGWVAAGTAARDAEPAEEWLAGPTSTIRLFRLLAELVTDRSPRRDARRWDAARARGPTVAPRSRSSRPAASTVSPSWASRGTC